MASRLGLGGDQSLVNKRRRHLGKDTSGSHTQRAGAFFRAPKPQRNSTLMLSLIFLPVLALAQPPVLGDPAATNLANQPILSVLDGQPADLGFRAFYEDGLVFDWDGGNLVVEGLFEVGAYLNEGTEGKSRDPESDTYVKRMRPEFAGRFDGGWRFRFEPKFDESGVELEEAWVGREILDGDAVLRFGRMKAPFGLEEIRSRRHIHFPRFSILNQFSPAEDHGVFVTGESGRFEYGYAVYNGTGGAEEDSGKDVALHGMWHSAAGGESAWQVGAAATYGRQDREVGGDGISNAGGREVLQYATDTRLNGDRLRFGLEGAWFQGPLMVQGELLSVTQEMSNVGGEDVTISGFYVDVARSLTGEDLDFGGIEDPTDSWLAALRVSRLSLSDEFEGTGLLMGGTFTDRIDSVSAGVNWVPNAHMILRSAWTHSWYGETVAVGGEGVDDEGLLTIELQLHF
ncbi:MAG: phosphate-selective porin [Gammaproteobacteria bacterium]|jgi:phosphate-selective porin